MADTEPRKCRRTPKTHCKRGHEIAVVGVMQNGECRECNRQKCARYNEAHRDQLRKRMRHHYALRRELERLDAELQRLDAEAETENRE